ncbi:hypothetical protein IAR55_003018 [Kwoniella newhampshirensis]|uniref:JmjC domain-containing protein n=1 Tax=Kwoniella newhampshirensis TaxID=1651941 RepID=A0AAW0Z078_9TREE
MNKKSHEIIRILRDEYLDGQLQTARDIAACGPAVLTVLTRSTRALCDHIPSTDDTEISGFRSSSSSPISLSHFEIRIGLKTLFTLASESINSIPFNLVPRHWLRLYTDTSLLLSLSDLILSDGPEDGSSKFWLESVRRLDMAIIVAGGIGEKRSGWIQHVIKEIQRVGFNGHTSSSLSPSSSSSSHTASDSAERPAKRPRIEPPLSSRLLYAPNPIPVLDGPPSVTKYLASHIDHPFIIRGYSSDAQFAFGSHWPALGRWRSAEYLLAQAGQGRVVPVEIGRAYDDSHWGQKIIPLERFLRRAGFKSDEDEDLAEDEAGSNDNDDDDDAPLYLAQYGLFDQFPDLAKDISYPDYVWSNPPVPPSIPSYEPPGTDDGVIVNVWIGSGGGEIVSPAHTDPYYNCYAQVLGQKRVWLAAPSSSPYMNAYGSTTTSAHDTSSVSEPDLAPDRAAAVEDEEDGLAEKYMTNTSKIPLLRPLSHDYDSFESMLKNGYPDFYEHVWPVSLEAVLQPGDLMVMPPGWWHAMKGEGEGPGWSVSMWY